MVDSLDWLERLIWAEVCRKRNVESIEDIGYAKGYVFALTQWREFLEGLSALRNDKGMTVVLIAHARIERFENPETESYDRYVPRLHRLRVAGGAGVVRRGPLRHVTRSTPSRRTRASTASGARASAPASGSSARVERPAHVAKNRLNLPEEMPLDWNAYAQYLTNGSRRRKARRK